MASSARRRLSVSWRAILMLTLLRTLGKWEPRTSLVIDKTTVFYLAMAVAVRVFKPRIAISPKISPGEI